MGDTDLTGVMGPTGPTGRTGLAEPANFAAVTRLAGRRRFLGWGGAACLFPALGGCAAAVPARADWARRLHGRTVALLGEVHDNAEHHRLRTAALRKACSEGWRPAVVMEQFDLDRQADLDRARRARPRDVAYLIAQAGGAAGWDWQHYAPVIDLALEYALPLRAANLPRAQAARIVREGIAPVLGTARTAELGLAAPPDAAWQALQEREIEVGHCGALPVEVLPRMARAQFVRDALMADVLRRHAQGPAVLLAGNGHVRRDIGVPRWLGAIAPERLWTVGFLEGADEAAGGRFDAVVVTQPAERPDPCLQFRRR